MFRGNPEEKYGRRESDDRAAGMGFANRVASRSRKELEILRDAQTEGIAQALLRDHGTASAIPEEAARQAVGGTDIEPEVVVALAGLIEEERGEERRAA